MRTILEQLFLGNIEPNEKYYGDKKRYNEVMKIICEHEDKLTSFLSDDEKEVVKKFTNAQIELNSLTACEKFVFGFKLGARVMLEALDGDLHK